MREFFRRRGLEAGVVLAVYRARFHAAIVARRAQPRYPARGLDPMAEGVTV